MISVYSDKTKKFYNTVEEANRAEFELKEEENRKKILAERKAAEEKARKEKLANERKERAAAVDAARKTMIEAQNAYRQELESFCKDYGTYHMSLPAGDIPTLFNDFFTLF